MTWVFLCLTVSSDSIRCCCTTCLTVLSRTFLMMSRQGLGRTVQRSESIKLVCSVENRSMYRMGQENLDFFNNNNNNNLPLLQLQTYCYNYTVIAYFKLSCRTGMVQLRHGIGVTRGSYKKFLPVTHTRTIPCLYSQAQIITAVWLVLIAPTHEGMARLS